MKYDITIIGGGIVGLAISYRILNARPDCRLLLLEKEASVASHQTGNNSGVIHSGIYYKPGSLKAKNCREGYRELLEFCLTHDIPHEICGKMIVATSESELPGLDELYRRGMANGLQGLRYLTKEELTEQEPHVRGIKGLHVPETGIIHFPTVASHLLRLIEKAGGDVHLGEKVHTIRDHSGMVQVQTDKDDYQTRVVISCAGLHSDRVARMTRANLPLRIIPFRGEYYKIKKEKHYLVRNLIYPVPDPAFPFLGVHFTRMLDGEIEAGPNAVLAFAREGYKKSDISISDVSEILLWPGFRKIARKYWATGLGELHRSLSKKAFARALRHLIPDIREEDLASGGAGVRAQACHRNGSLLDDFCIVEDKNAIHVCNAPSPAATSSLEIGSAIQERVFKRLDW